MPAGVRGFISFHVAIVAEQILLCNGGATFHYHNAFRVKAFLIKFYVTIQPHIKLGFICGFAISQRSLPPGGRWHAKRDGGSLRNHWSTKTLRKRTLPHPLRGSPLPEGASGRLPSPINPNLNTG